MDAVSLLRKDHQTVEILFKRFEKAGERAHEQKRGIVEQLVHALAIHAAIEEQFLYPLVRERDERLKKLALESLEEHHVVKWTLSELDRLSPTNERFDAKVKLLIESVRRHVEEEENEMFPLMEKLMPEDELNVLGEVLQKAKAGAPTRPHPRAPDEPPGNLIVGMMSKVVDSGADALRTVRRRGLRAMGKTVRASSPRKTNRRKTKRS